MKKKIEDIVAAYNSEIRGFYNYYCIANNVAYALSKFGYIMEYSMYHTIAAKTNSTVSKVIDKYKIGNDIIVPYQDAKVTYGTESSIMRDSNVNRQCTIRR